MPIDISFCRVDNEVVSDRSVLHADAEVCFMVVGVLQLDLMIYESNSLKDKRSVSRRLTADLQHTYKISVAEVEFQDLLNRLGLGIAVAGSEARLVERTLQSIEDHIASFPEVEILSADREILHI